MQLTCRDKRAYVMLRRGYNLYRSQFVLIQDVHDHWVEQKPYAVGKGSPVRRYALGGGLFSVESTSGIINLYPAGKRYFSSSISLFRVAMTFRLGKWALSLSYISERVGAPGKTIP